LKWNLSEIPFPSYLWIYRIFRNDKLIGETNLPLYYDKDVAGTEINQYRIDAVNLKNEIFASI
jgi:hypothetical protein